jgi:hypothetical protein
MRLLAAGLLCLSLGTGTPASAQVIYHPKPDLTPARATPLQLDKKPLPDAVLGRRYAQTFPVEGGVPPYRFDISGHLPDGMKAVVLGNTVLIEGVPQAMGEYPLKLSLTDTLGQSQTGTYTLHVTPYASNAAVSITVAEGLKAADSLGNGGGGVADREAVKAADSVTVSINGSAIGNIFSVPEAIKVADSITISINGSTVGNIFSVPESIKAADSITIQVNGSTIGSVFSIPEAIKAADNITIQLNGLTVGGSGPMVSESIKTADTITILLNGLTVGGSGPTIPESIKTTDAITIQLNGSVIGSIPSVHETIKTADTISITLNGLMATGIADPESIKATDSITILINGLSPGGGGKQVAAAEGVKELEAITITLNGTTVTSSVPVFVREPIKASDTITITLDGQPTNVPLTIAPTAIPDAVYSTAYSQTFTPSGGTGSTVTFGHSGALPAGLSFSGGTGSLTLSGTPTATGTFPITITATDGTNNATRNVTLIVDQAQQTITIGSLPTPTYGGSPFSLSATSTSGLPVTITATGGPVSGNGPYTITGAGTATFQATQAGNSNYAAAALVNFSVTIAPATLLVTPTGVSRPFDTPNPAFTYTIAPFVNGDTSAVISGTPTLTTTATGTSPAGTYPITADVSSMTAANYIFTPAAGTLTITGGDAQTIVFPQPPTLTTGQSYHLAAFTTSGLPVTYTVSGAGSLNGNYVVAGGSPGTITVTASQPGNASYAAATSVVRSFNVQ